MTQFRFGMVTLLALLALTGCARQFGTVPEAISPNVNAAGHPIRHVVIVVQEARTFENLFAGWPGANAPLEATAQRVPYPVKLKPISYAQDRDVCDLYGCMTVAYAGRFMNGFNMNTFSTLGSDKTDKGKDAWLFPYAYMDHVDIAPYRKMASEYVLADGMFATAWGGDFTAHQDLIGGSTFTDAHHTMIDVPNARPWGCDAPRGTQIPIEHVGSPVKPAGYGIFPCVTQYPTMADLLDKAGLDWSYYVAPLHGTDPSGQLWNAFDAIKKVRYGPDWRKHIVSPPSQVLVDAADGKLPAVSWVIPELKWSDHPSQTSDLGPSWVAAIVNSIGEGPDWDSTAIVVVWSEWGGWYDNMLPASPNALKGSGFGLRVPCLIISPYARKNHVTHTVYSFGSILKFIEENFGLSSLSTLRYGYGFADSTSRSISDSFDFSKPARAFSPIPAKYPPSTFGP